MMLNGKERCNELNESNRKFNNFNTYTNIFVITQRIDPIVCIFELYQYKLKHGFRSITYDKKNIVNGFFIEEVIFINFLRTIEDLS